MIFDLAAIFRVVIRFNQWCIFNIWRSVNTTSPYTLHNIFSCLNSSLTFSVIKKAKYKKNLYFISHFWYNCTNRKNFFFSKINVVKIYNDDIGLEWSWLVKSTTNDTRGRERNYFPNNNNQSRARSENTRGKFPLTTLFTMIFNKRSRREKFRSSIT